MSLRTRIRTYLGVDTLHRLESKMATITNALTALAKQVNDVSAAQASSFHNLQAAIDKLKSGELSSEQQAAVDEIEKSLTQLGDDAQSADDGYEPSTPPVLNGDTDTPAPADGTNPDVPADGTDAGAPAEGDTGRTSRR